MKKLYFLFFLLLAITTHAQNKISGTVIDQKSGEAIIQGSVQLLAPKDSLQISGTTTNLNGQFKLNVKPGKYILAISYLGYQKKHININASQQDLALGKITLNEDGILLAEAVVTAKAAEIAVKGDTLEYNADSYKVQPSAVVEDILKKMPGAEVDADGKITINGKEVKKILVDGKEFFSTDPKVASKNLPASMVDKLQVLDQKSDMAQMTGFDDGQEETVINLTVKKGMKQGLFGNLSAGIGNKNRYGISGMANYMHNNNQFTIIGGSNNSNNQGFSDNAGNSFRGMHGRGMSFGGRNGITKSGNGGFNFSMTPSKKLKWGGNVAYGHNNTDLKTSTYTERYKEDPSLNEYTSEKGNGTNKSDNFSTNLRFEWTPDSLTKVIFTPSMQYGKNKNLQSTDYLTTFANPADSINWGYRNDFNDGHTSSANAGLDISRRLGKKGRTLSFSFSGGFSNLDNDGSNFSQTTYRREIVDSLVMKDQRFHQKNKNYNWRAYISYVEPLGRNNFLQFNYSIRRNDSESDKKAFLNNGSDEYLVVDTTSTKKLENNFLNQEIGINFKSVRQKYNYTIGFAVQPSRSESWTTVPNMDAQKVSNNVVNFSPVAQFNYLWDKRHNLRLDYSGSTTQPTTTQLSAVRDESDPINITVGNPDLKPAFNNNLRIRYHNFNPEKASVLMLFGGVGFTTNAIVSKSKSLSGGRTESTYDNVNGNWNANLRMIINRPLRNKKFSVSSMTFGNYQADNGFIDGMKNKANIINLNESAGLQYRSDLFDASLRGNFGYSNTNNSLPNQQGRNIYNYGGLFSTSWYLPYDFSIDTDITYSANSGASTGFQKNEWLWNASLSKQIFKAKNGIIKFNIYDILKQQTNISQSQTSYMYRENRTNSLSRFFMFSFIYKFQIFKGGAKANDMQGMRGIRGGHRPTH